VLVREVCKYGCRPSPQGSTCPPLFICPPTSFPCRYDADTALVLCRLSSFKEGLVLLYDRLRLHREVLQVSGQGAARFIKEQARGNRGQNQVACLLQGAVYKGAQGSGRSPMYG
jgi:hypothetical protein